MKITEKVLLEKGSPNTNKLNGIKTLNLSRMSLKSTDLLVPLLSQLSVLEKLDLSFNLLRKFPEGLVLPCLKVLDCSSNVMEDVLSLQSLSNLQELLLEDNPFLTANDEHKVMFLLPKLRLFNGKDISSTARYIRHGGTDILKKRVVGVWKQSFHLPDPIVARSVDSVTRSFVKAACAQVKHGPSSLSTFTEWRVETIAKEYVNSLISKSASGWLSDTVEHEISSVGNVNDEASGHRSLRTRTDNTEENGRRSRDLNGEAAGDAAPHKTERSFSSPRKPAKRDATCEDFSPRKSRRLESVSRRSVEPESAANLTTDLAKSKSSKRTSKADSSASATLQLPQEPLNLQPCHALQCHSRQDSCDDFSTQLWACAFEPSEESCAGWRSASRAVATCGGETLCVIDCESGLVMKKYKVPGEDFFSLAWSTVLMHRADGSSRTCNVLAAGGRRGLVKLIHPRVNLAFGEFRSSRKPISILRFSPKNSCHLFVGTYENNIILWDVGELDRDYNIKISKLLVLETSSVPLHLCLLPTAPDVHLLAACDDGLFSFDIQLSNNKQKRNAEMEIVFPIYEKSDKNNSYRTIDGMSFLSDNVVASKSQSQGSIYLWSWRDTHASWSSSHGATSAVVLAQLQWTNTEVPYLSLGTCPGCECVVCGDEQGRIWLYHITQSTIKGLKAGQMITPTRVLEWPSPVLKGGKTMVGPSINSVAMAPGGQYLVSLTDKNVVLIWKREGH